MARSKTPLTPNSSNDAWVDEPRHAPYKYLNEYLQKLKEHRWAARREGKEAEIDKSDGEVPKGQ